MKLYFVEGADNIRDLGGYPVPGGTLPKGRFVRAGSLSGLTGQGRRELDQIGVDCIVDMRSTFETKRDPDAVEGLQADTHHVPMLDYIQSSIAGGDFSSFPTSMAQMYKGLLDYSQEELLRVFRIFAQERYKTVLFHCTAGKDRTGVVAMLLLDLAGVEEEKIVSDYAASDKLVGAMGGAAMTQLPPEMQYLVRSEPATMQAALAHLREHYRDAAGYLQAIGLTDDELDALRRKLAGV